MAPRKRISKKRLTAFHEAGHAFAGWFLKRGRLEYVTVESNEDSYGHVLWLDLKKKFEPDVESDSRTSNHLNKIIKVSIAGDLAEKILKGTDARGVDSQALQQEDYSKAIEYALHYACGDADEAGAYVNYLYYSTRNFLKLPWHWAAVESLAEALLKHRTLGKKEVDRIIRESIDSFRERESAGR